MSVRHCPRRSLIAALLICSCQILLAAPTAAQSTWGRFTTAVPIGGGSLATTQSLPLTVAGSGRGTGTASLTFSVAGGVAAWNGYGVGANDDGYYAAPNLPIAGVIAINGAPGYNGGVPALAAASFATAYNAPAAPAGTPLPTDRSAIYFDAGDGTTATIGWDFSALNGGKLLAGSWIFIDGIDQGERIVLSGPAGWIASVHVADSTLPRPEQPGLPPILQAPMFPACSPAVTLSATGVQLDGRYGDFSTPLPTCSAVPVPVAGVTVGYTKGMDSVGVWIKTAIDISALSLTANDQDTTPRNAQGAYLGPDNNFVLGVGLIAMTEAPAIPGPGRASLLAMALLLCGITWGAMRNGGTSRTGRSPA